MQESKNKITLHDGAAIQTFFVLETVLDDGTSCVTLHLSHATS